MYKKTFYVLMGCLATVVISITSGLIVGVTLTQNKNRDEFIKEPAPTLENKLNLNRFLETKEITKVYGTYENCHNPFNVPYFLGDNLHFNRIVWQNGIVNDSNSDAVYYDSSSYYGDILYSEVCNFALVTRNGEDTILFQSNRSKFLYFVEARRQIVNGETVAQGIFPFSSIASTFNLPDDELKKVTIHYANGSDSEHSSYTRFIYKSEDKIYIVFAQPHRSPGPIWGSTVTYTFELEVKSL